MEDLSRIKLKISKLMNLAEKASNEHEAANAAAKARALMDKYQLDIMDVEGVEATEFVASSTSRVYAAMPSHVSVLAVAVAKFNDCQAVYDWQWMPEKGKQGKVITFRGMKDDVEMALDMFARLQGSVEGLCTNYFTCRSGVNGVKHAAAFKQGAVSTLCELLKKDTDENRAKLQMSNGTSLMVMKENAVAAYFGDAKYVNKKGRSMDDGAFHAYQEGAKRAHDIQVHAKRIE